MSSRVVCVVCHNHKNLLVNVKYLFVFVCVHSSSQRLNELPVLPAILVTNNMIDVYKTAAVGGVLGALEPLAPLTSLTSPPPTPDLHVVLPPSPPSFSILHVHVRLYLLLVPVSSYC